MMFTTLSEARLTRALRVAIAAGASLAASHAQAQSVQQLTGHPSVNQDNLGSATAVHGEWAIVGARTGGPGASGAAQVFRFDPVAETWSFVQQLTSSNPQVADYGAALAAGDGLLIVGAPCTGVGANNEVGLVEVWKLSPSGDSWVSAGTLASPVQQADAMYGMDLAFDGSALAVAMAGNSGGSPVAPRVYVYRHTGGGAFSSPETITPPAGVTATHQFGFDIDILDIDAQGDLVVVGAPLRGTLGQAYVYRNNSGTSWTLNATLSTSNGGPVANFGTGVALTEGYAFVGSPFAVGLQGTVEVFDQDASWSNAGVFPPMGVDPGKRFGSSIDAEGPVVIASAPGAESGLNEFGRAWTIVDPDGDGGWVFDLADPIAATSPANGDSFGFDVATSELNVIAGAPTNETLNGAGKAYAVRLDAPFEDCNDNGIPDNTEEFADCNANGIPDVCEGILFDITGYDMTSPTMDETTGGATLLFNGMNFPSGEQGMQVFFEYDGYRVEVPKEQIIAFPEPDPPMGGCTQLMVTVPAFPPPCDCGVDSFTEFNADIIFFFEEPGLGMMKEVRLSSLPGAMSFTYFITKSIVPPDSPIQPFINAAFPGTCIVLSQDVYTENLSFGPGDDRMTLTSTDINDPSETRVRGGTSVTPSLPTIRFSGDISETTVCGINIVLGNSGVVIENGASITLFKNRIENNFSSGPGGGVLVTDGAMQLASTARIMRNSIVLNTAGGEGGGVAVINSLAEIIDNRFINNTAGGPGGGLSVNNADATVYTNDFISNTATGSGGGINLIPSVSIAVRDNLVQANTASGGGGGINLDSVFDVDLSVNDIGFNDGNNGDGGGVFIAGPSTATVRYNRILDNQISRFGGGLYLDGESEPDVTNNMISENFGTSSASRGGGIFVGGFNISTIHENIIKDNLAQRGGAIAADLKSEPDIFRNVIAFNQSTALPPFPSPPTFAPGILVGDLDEPVGPAPDIIQNTLYMNVHNGSTDTGTIHGLRIGLFEPDWSENIIALGMSGGQMWGVFCEDGPNTGVRIDYNALQSMTTDAIDPFCAIPGGPPFVGNTFGDPMFIDPMNCDFRMYGESFARTNGMSNGFSGSVQPDAVIGGSLTFVQDTGSETLLEWPGGGTAATPTEVYIDVEHLPREFATSGETLRARTLFIQLNSFANDMVGVLPAGSGMKLTIPLRTPMEPGSQLTLYRSTNPNGPFLAFGRTGLVGQNGRSVSFDNIGPAQVSQNAYIFVGASLGQDCNGNGVFDLAEFVDVNMDGIFDICQALPCRGDVNGDLVVNFVDVLDIMGGLGTKNPPLDVDDNGTVTINDILEMIPDFGECQPIEPRPVTPVTPFP